MAKDPNPVEIHVKSTSDTKALEKARTELENVEKAAEEARKVISNAGGEGVLGGWDVELEKTEAKAAELREEVGRLEAAEKRRSDSAKENERKRQDALKEEAEEARRREVEIVENTRRIKLNQIAQAVGFAAQQLSGATKTLREVSVAASEVDEDLGRDLENIATGFDGIQTAVSGAATGFAAGGPVGAIIGGLAGLASAPLKKEIDGLVTSLNSLAESKAIGAAMPARIEAIKDAFLLENQAEGWEKLRSKIELVNIELEESRKIEKAKRDLNQFLADEDVRVAKAAGGDVEGASKRAADVRTQNQAAEVNAKVATAANELFQAQTAYAIKVAEAEQATANATEKEKELSEARDDLLRELDTPVRTGDDASERSRKKAELKGLEVQAATTIREQNEASEKLTTETNGLAAAIEAAKIKFASAQALAEIERTVNTTRAKNDEALPQVTESQTESIRGLEQIRDKAEGNKELAPLVEAINKALDDGRIDSAEAQLIPAKLNQYARQVASLGGEVLGIMNETLETLGDLSRDMAKIKSQQGNPNP